MQNDESEVPIVVVKLWHGKILGRDDRFNPGQRNHEKRPISFNSFLNSSFNKTTTQNTLLSNIKITSGQKKKKILQI